MSNEFKGTEFVFFFSPVLNADKKGLRVKLTKQFTNHEFNKLMDFWLEDMKVKFVRESDGTEIEIDMQMKTAPQAKLAAKGNQNLIVTLDSLYDAEKAKKMIDIEFKIVDVVLLKLNRELDFGDDEEQEEF